MLFLLYLLWKIILSQILLDFLIMGTHTKVCTCVFAYKHTCVCVQLCVGGAVGTEHGFWGLTSGTPHSELSEHRDYTADTSSAFSLTTRVPLLDTDWDQAREFPQSPLSGPGQEPCKSR